MANLPIFAIGKYSAIQSAIDLKVLTYPSYVFVDDEENAYNNCLAFIDKDLDIRIIGGESAKKQVLRVDELPAVEDGDLDVLYIYENTVYVFTGEEYKPSASDSGIDLSDIEEQVKELSEQIVLLQDQVTVLSDSIRFIELDEDEDTITVTSVEQLEAAVASDEITEIILGEDIVAEGTKAVALNNGMEKTLDLNGYNISIDGGADDTIYAIHVSNGSTLNLYDSGDTAVVDAGTSSDFNMGVSAFGGSTINIYGGSYTCGTDLEEATGSSTVYAADGVINVYGGYFENKAMGEHKDCDVLNIRNNSGSYIYCYGGEFLDQNPADGDDKDTATGSTFLAEGCTVTESEKDGHTLYTVTKAD